jgi:hypothetical protein
MAGFAVVMTILMYGIIGILGACVLSTVFFFAARKKLRREGRNDRSLVLISTIAPFLALGWLIAALLIHVQISNRLAHQDCGLSGDPYVTLPNGYELGSHNTYDGYIRAPGVQTDGPIAGPGYVRSIIHLNLVGDKFIGTQFDFRTSSVRRFTFDTKTQAFQSEPEGPLSWEAANDQAPLGDQSYWQLYSRYRHHWPNYILLILIVGGECAIGLLIRRAWTTKRRLENHPI